MTETESQRTRRCLITVGELIALLALIVRDFSRMGTLGERITALLIVGAGVALAFDWWQPWLFLGLAALTVIASYFLSENLENDDDHAGPLADRGEARR